MTPGLHAADLRRIFHRLDRNGDGLLSIDELGEGGGGESAAAVERDLEEAFRVFDLNGDGLITSEELQKVLSSLEGGGGEEDCVKRAFEVFDVDGDGFISCEELEDVLKRLGLWDEKSGRDPAAMICKFDKNFDGLLDFDEFRTMVM
ncbi:unnamed protein product [Linum tenue]|uniref:EF-hand domain-containing protein n=1 Tax=Linum tenue TaxID=586396 RepID=A0AAV0I7N4_9ROSI|nr:unnamed protein product [Linum tenue]